MLATHVLLNIIILRDLIYFPKLNFKIKKKKGNTKQGLKYTGPEINK